MTDQLGWVAWDKEEVRPSADIMGLTKQRDLRSIYPPCLEKEREVNVASSARNVLAYSPDN
jgi:hypothetical protein